LLLKINQYFSKKRDGSPHLFFDFLKNITILIIYILFIYFINMNSYDLQTDLQALIWDTRTKWLPDDLDNWSKWDSLKSAIKYGIKETFDRLKQNALYWKQNNTELVLTTVDGKVDIPADFEIDYKIFNSFSEEIFDYTIQKKQGKIILDDESSQDITLQYLVKENTLSVNADEPYLDEHFRDSITAYAMEKYHLAQFDWDNAAKSVAYAEDKIEDLISKYY